MPRRSSQSAEPINCYRIAPTSEAARHGLRIVHAASQDVLKALRNLRTPHRALSLGTAKATALYDAVEFASPELGLPIPLRFTPMRRSAERRAEFEAIPLGPVELLHLVHQVFWSAARGREAALAAVESCGAQPVHTRPECSSSQGLAAVAKRYVDALIDHEPELRRPSEGSFA